MLKRMLIALMILMLCWPVLAFSKEGFTAQPLPEKAKTAIQKAYTEHMPAVVEAQRELRVAQSHIPKTVESKDALDASNAELYDAFRKESDAGDALRRSCPGVNADQAAVGFVGYIYSADAPERFPTPCHLVRVIDSTSCLITVDGVAFWLHVRSTAALTKSGASDFPYHTRRKVTWGPGNQMYHVTEQTTHPDIGDGKTPVWVAEEVDASPFNAEARRLTKK